MTGKKAPVWNYRVTAKVFKQLKDLHKEMWLWLAENPYADKSEWPGWNTLPDVLGVELALAARRYWCFACAACKLDCRKCPVRWGWDAEDSEDMVCVSSKVWSRVWVAGRNRKRGQVVAPSVIADSQAAARELALKRWRRR